MSRFKTYHALCVCGLLTWLATSPAWSQQRPTVGYAFPSGGSAGTTIDVQLGGYDWTPDTQFIVLDDDVVLKPLSLPGPLLYPGAPYWFGPRALNSYKPFPIPREIAARLTIPADTPAGVIRWQVVNANGASQPAEFVITRDVAEYREDALTVEQAHRQLPALPCVINGRLEKKEEVDRYSFVAALTGLVTCEVPKIASSATLHAAVRVSDEQGQVIVDQIDTTGRGTALTFRVKKGVRYELVVHDLDFHGNRAMVYRLAMRTGPRVVAMRPTRLPPNSETEVAFIGYGLATGQPQLEQRTATVRSGKQSFDYVLNTEYGSTGSIPIAVSERVETVADSLPNTEPISISLPACLSGVLDQANGYGAYRFEAKAGEVWSVELTAQTRDRTMDLRWTLFDANGKVVSEVDDAGQSLDPRALIKIPADGIYHLLVADDAAANGSLASVYRLCLSTPRSRFRITVPKVVESVIGAEPITIAKKRRAGRQQVGAIGIDVERIDGFDGEITMQITGLPAGVETSENLQIRSSDMGIDIGLRCNEAITPGGYPLVVHATATIGDGIAVTQEATCLLAPIMRPRALIRPKYPDAARTVNRGTTYPAPVVVERLAGYEGAVELQMAAVPDRVRQGILGHSSVIPAGTDEGVFPLIIPEWVQTDRTSRIILNSLVRIPAADGQMRTLVNRMQRRITMNVEGALLKLNPNRSFYPWQRGELTIGVELFRAGNLQGPVTLSLYRQRQDGTISEDEPVVQPRQIAADQTYAELNFVPAAEEASSAVQTYLLNATAMHEGYPVQSQTKILVGFRETLASQGE